MGRSFGDLIAGAMGKIEDAKNVTDVAAPSQAPGLAAELEAAKSSGDKDEVTSVINRVAQRRQSLSEGLVKPTKKKKSVAVDINASVLPSAAELAAAFSGGTARSKPAEDTTPKVFASQAQMQDVAAEINNGAGEATRPGQYSPTQVKETPEAKEMEASPEGPTNPPVELASYLMDRLESHHAHLTHVLKTLPDQLRAHGDQSPYFGPAHHLFADKLQTDGEAGLDKPDRLALREKRDLIASSPVGGSNYEIKKRNAILDQNYAAMTYSDAPSVKSSYIQDVPSGGPIADKSLARRGAALLNTYGEISSADSTAMQNVPAHIKALTVGLPSRLGALKVAMDEARSNGTFANDDPSKNHKAIMDFADSLNQINNSINSSIASGTRSAIKDTFSGTGMKVLPERFKNFFGTNIHKGVLKHLKWMGKGLSQKQPGESWRNHSEPHPDWVVGEQPNLTNVLRGLFKKGLKKEQVMSKPGHVWGMIEKDKFGHRVKGGNREQIQISKENGDKLRASNEADQTGVASRDVGNHINRIIKDYNNGDTAKYSAYELPSEWQPTSGRGGSGSSRLKGSGDVKVQRANQDLYPYTEEAVEEQEKRSKPIVLPDGTRVPAGTGNVFVKGTKKKVVRSQNVLGKEATVSGTSRRAAIGKVKELTGLAKVIARAKTAGTTYDKNGETKPFSDADAEVLSANPDATLDVFTHIRNHQQLIEKHATTIREQGKETIPQEDRKFLGASGMAEAHRRANL